MATAKFKVRETFEKPARQSLVLVGTIVEGDIHPDMFVRVPLKPGRRINLLIDVSFDCQDPKEEYSVSVTAGPNIMEIVWTLKLDGQTLEVEDFTEE